jgi:DNA primase
MGDNIRHSHWGSGSLVSAASANMQFPPKFLDELRARLPVSEVVGKRVKLRKAGREWKGLSPFMKERSPSFFVNDQKGFYHDFSSGKHGDIFTFVIETEGVTFAEAVERLAALAGMLVPVVSEDAASFEIGSLTDLRAWLQQQPYQRYMLPVQRCVPYPD